MAARIVGLSGSLRAGSLNTKLLHAAAHLAPSAMFFEVRTLEDVPLYSGDLEAESMPAAAVALGAAIAAADAVVIASPEYNYSLPGVLKNGIDWLSRLDHKPFAGKPLAIMGVSPGRFGTARMQYHLRQVLLFTEARVLAKPEVMLGGGDKLFDDAGRLADEAAADLVRRQLEVLAAGIDEARRLKG